MMLAMLLLGPALVATTPAPSSTTNRCAAPGADRAAVRPAPSGRAQRLNEMPPARGVLTVYRRVGGCPVLLVRDGGRIVEEPADRPDGGRAVRR